MMDVAFRARAGSGEKLSVLQVMKPLRSKETEDADEPFSCIQEKKGLCLSICLTKWYSCPTIVFVHLFVVRGNV